LNGGSYIVIPRKNDDHLNGVSTLDLVMIQRHILGLEKLNTPGKLIAADITKDQKIAASDIVELRKLILGITNSFKNNESWRFVDKSYRFQDPKNAYAELLPENYKVDAIKENMHVDFTSIKVGDVNNSVVLEKLHNQLENRNSRVLTLSSGVQKVLAGQSIQVPVMNVEPNTLTGFQFTIHFDPSVLALESINGNLPGMTDNNFGFTKLSSGMLAVSYHQDKEFELLTGSVMFTLVFRAREDGSLQDMVSIGSGIAHAEAYSQDYSLLDIKLEWQKEVRTEALLHQNTPNPFISTTYISFELTELSNTVITIYDAFGKVVHTIYRLSDKGYNALEVNQNQLAGPGVYYYSIQAGDFKATRKMVVIE